MILNKIVVELLKKSLLSAGIFSLSLPYLFFSFFYPYILIYLVGMYFVER